ncbi:MAG TPA: FAD binding domain-containing protein [Stellaceae bacterium]|nr:FAD binding domain-containing protein [Stellaceae bacterium]
MKPARFDYACPASLDEAVALLAAHPGEAKPLAGGQSLMPALNFRLAQPALLVDLRKVPGLDRIAVGADGVRLGARVRWCDIERDGRLAAAHPLLKEAVTHIAHYQIRNRGTVGGSLAHADPAAELPGIAVACDATIRVTGKAGARGIAAARFFTGALATALQPDEIITELHLPAWPAGRRWGFEEFALRRGDFALAGVAAFYDPAGGRAANTHIGVIGASSHAHRIAAAEAALDGKTPDEAAILAAARAAAAAVDPPSDLHADAEYRRALVEVLVERALKRAAAQ